MRKGCIARLLHKSHALKNALLNKGRARRRLSGQEEGRMKAGCGRQTEPCVCSGVQLPTPPATPAPTTSPAPSFAPPFYPLPAPVAALLVEICALLHFDLLLWLDNWRGPPVSLFPSCPVPGRVLRVLHLSSFGIMSCRCLQTP